MPDTAIPETVTVVFPLFEGVTQLDFTGPHQLFSRVPGLRVTAASLGGRPIEADGLRFDGLADLARVGRCDLLCVPGGYGTTAAIGDAAYLAEIRRLAAGARWLTSVCTGSLVLAAAGLLKGRRAACHWAWRELLRPFGAIPDDGRVVRDGRIITGGGVTAGLDFALAVVAELFDRPTAEAVQLALEYAPAPPFEAGRPETAPAAVAALVRARLDAGLAERRAAVEAAARQLQPA
ncbi:DJ-1/PfpI family protein [Tistlia consotensis]|uniref:DJ-1/PfpI family protein n=1 Tax=Tistlia consotensis USBA 355 TaxID=560819 RepID=A0A1Y6BHE4_9PROT|nr:DJ-1/PfpI family protein [Tistlia consotensis]SMF10184.1 DJ-1/PfpI family protein [Tistlia consotensis USBA 355]SNR33921.1 DJ-1/PfpI family protein [Tistlia consotensis]